MKGGGSGALCCVPREVFDIRYLPSLPSGFGFFIYLFFFSMVLKTAQVTKSRTKIRQYDNIG